jgi:hypothetical protein
MIGVNGPIGAAPPTPATNIQVIGGSYNDNGFEGILIASCANTIAPQNIQLVGVAALNNNGRGISVEAGWDVLIASPTVADSGAQGIWLANLPVQDFPDEPCDASDPFYLTHQYRRPCDCKSPDPSFPRTTRVQISNANVYNNGRLVNVSAPGIGLDAIDQVLITGGKLSKTPAMAALRRQDYGVTVHNRPTSLPGFSDTCTNIRILDVDASVGQIKPVAALDVATFLEDDAAAAQSGYYRIQGNGSPEGSISAPPGSDYVDLTTGSAYRKGSGTGSTGWVLT